MLTVKLVKYDTSPDNQPTHTTEVTLRECTTVHMKFEADGRQVLQLGDAPDPTWDVTIGQNRNDVQFNAAFVMNSDGKTVEVLRGY